MKIAVTGANGNSGRRIVDLALRQGHEVVAIVRDAATVEKADRVGLSVRANSFDDESLLAQAMQGADVVVNAAFPRQDRFQGRSDRAMRGADVGADNANDKTLVQRVIGAAEKALGPGGRFWGFGGAGALDIPGTGKSTLDLPKIPAVFEAHRTNLNALRSTGLDWSMLCPGPMIDAPDGKATEGLRLSADEWPVPRPGWTRMLPPVFTALAFKNALPAMTIYYEDAAVVILGNLDRRGPYSCKRVGVALPRGKTRHKDL